MECTTHTHPSSSTCLFRFHVILRLECGRASRQVTPLICDQFGREVGSDGDMRVLAKQQRYDGAPPLLRLAIFN